MIVKTTYHGEIDCPEDIADRSKFWAEVLFDRLRCEELYGLIEKMRREAFNAGFYSGAGASGYEGSIPDEPTEATEGGTRPSGDEGEIRSISGCSEQGPQCLGIDQEGLATCNWD